MWTKSDYNMRKGDGYQRRNKKWEAFNVQDMKALIFRVPYK
jgi:hypothetical protein